MRNVLLQEMFNLERWEELIVNAENKGIDKSLLVQLCNPRARVKLYKHILNDKYEIAPPHIARIPKDDGTFREVYVNENIDRIVLTLINDSLSSMFKDMIHRKCRSYQKGIGTQETVLSVTKEIRKLTKNTNNSSVFIGYKSDLTRYFDSVKIEKIDNVFDTIEKKLGFEKGKEPVMNLLRRYYHNDLVFDIDNNLIEHYGSLKQGCAVAAFLSNVMLYDIDEALNSMDIIYYRYSDDLLMIGKDSIKAKETLEFMLFEYGLTLNPKKVEPLYNDKWFKFLGFNIKGNLITLSKNRLKRFQEEIEKRTIKKRDKKNRVIKETAAKRNVLKYLYKGDLSWASSCLGVINCKPDLDEMNKFIMDCIRACKTGKTVIGGLGSVTDREDRTVIRGKGKHVRANRDNTKKEIEDYLSLGCLAQNYKLGKCIYEAVVRSL